MNKYDFFEIYIFHINLNSKNKMQIQKKSNLPIKDLRTEAFPRRIASEALIPARKIMFIASRPALYRLF